MPSKPNLTATRQRELSKEIYQKFDRASGLSMRLNQFQKIFFPEYSPKAFTFHYQGDALICTYDRSKVVELDNDADLSNNIVEKFEEWLKTGKEKPFIIVNAPAVQPEQPQAPSDAAENDKFAALARENELLRQRLEALDRQPPPPPAAPEMVTQLVGAITAMGQQLEALQLAQRQQSAVISEAGARSMQAVNLASRAIGETRDVRSDVAQQVRSLTTFTKPALEELDLRVKRREQADNNAPSSPRRTTTTRTIREIREIVQQDEYEDSRGKRRRHQEVEEKPQESKETEPPVGRLMFHLVSRTILGAVGLSVKKRKF
jgi:hypothetical protein